MNNILQLSNAYDSCCLIAEKLLTNEFKNFVDKQFPPESFRPFKTAMITGYFVRCAEKLIGEMSPKSPDQTIKKILNSTKPNSVKNEDIANYLDKHDKLGLQEKVSDYSLFPFNDIKKFLEGVTEDLINSTIKEHGIPENMTRDFFDELIYRNLSFGYLYKLSEELVNDRKKDTSIKKVDKEKIQNNVYTCNYCGIDFDTKNESDEHERICNENSNKTNKDTPTLEVRTFGKYAGRWWFLYLIILSKLLNGTTTFTGNNFFDIIVLVMILTGFLYFGFMISGGEKLIEKKP